MRSLPGKLSVLRMKKNSLQKYHLVCFWMSICCALFKLFNYSRFNSYSCVTYVTSILFWEFRMNLLVY